MSDGADDLLKRTDDVLASAELQLKITRHVRDVQYWGMAYGTVIAPGMKPRGEHTSTPTPSRGASERTNSGGTHFSLPEGTPIRSTAKGTPDDPITVDGDIERAAELLGQGKSIRMNRRREVGTLVDRLRDIAKEAEEKGEKAPNYDLCKVSVPGTNLFCQQSKNIPRAEMPQFTGLDKDGNKVDARDDFVRDLAESDVETRVMTVPVDQLKASQMELVGVKISQMMKAMRDGKVDPDAPIFVTRDGYVLDGHHRWAARVAMAEQGGNPKMRVKMVDMEIGEAIDRARAFAKQSGIVPKDTSKVGPSTPK